MQPLTLDDLLEQQLLTLEQFEELSAHFRAPQRTELPPSLFEALKQAWALATMDEDATVH